MNGRTWIWRFHEVWRFGKEQAGSWICETWHGRPWTSACRDPWPFLISVPGADRPVTHQGFGFGAGGKIGSPRPRWIFPDVLSMRFLAACALSQACVSLGLMHTEALSPPLCGSVRQRAGTTPSRACWFRATGGSTCATDRLSIGPMSLSLWEWALCACSLHTRCYSPELCQGSFVRAGEKCRVLVR